MLKHRLARVDDAPEGSCWMDYASTFQPSKRPRLEPTGATAAAAAAAAAGQEKPRDHGDDDNEHLLVSASAAVNLTGVAAIWRLSREQEVAENERYLNEQLQHVAMFQGERRSREERAELLGACASVPFASMLALYPRRPLAQAEVETEAGADAARMETLIRDAMDVVSWLLVARQEDAARHHATADALRVAEKDRERKQTQIQQLQDEVEGLRQQLAHQENMFHGREQALVAERRALQQDKRQLEVMCAKLQGLETAYKAQLRRKDGEYERLRKSLQDAAQRSAKESKGMTTSRVLNDVKARKQTAARRVVQSPETMMTRQLIENLERKRDELLFENEALSLNFDALQRQVESVATQYKKAVQLFLAQRGNEGNTDETLELTRVPLDEFTPTPLQLGVKTNVPAYIADTLDGLTDKVKTFERAMRAELEYDANHPSREVVDILKAKLTEAHAIISEQDQLLQASLEDPVVEKENACANASKRAGRQLDQRMQRRVEFAVVETLADDLDAEWQAYQRKNKNLDEERQLLQERGTQLDEDRVAFELKKFEYFFGPTQNDDVVMVDTEVAPVPSPATKRILTRMGVSATSASPLSMR